MAYLSTPTADEVAQLHECGKQVLFNYADAGETRREKTAWRGAAEVGIDGLLTDYPLECCAVPAVAFRVVRLHLWVLWPWCGTRFGSRRRPGILVGGII